MRKALIVAAFILIGFPPVALAQAPGKGVVDISKAKPEKQTEQAAIKTLNVLLSKGADPKSAGACVYNAGDSRYCAVISQDSCNQLHGSWYEGQNCLLQLRRAAP